MSGFIYPSLCPACRVEVAGERGLCTGCWQDATFISGAVCRTCGVPVMAAFGEDVICDACTHAPPGWARGAAALVYDGTGRKLVLALKHGDRLDIAPLAATWMARAGPDLLRDADIIAPVPLHWRRMVKRRYNQAGELARELATRSGDAVLSLDLLRRTRWTGSQDGMTRRARHDNVATAFAIPQDMMPLAKGRSILLVDDVMTTGATLTACAEACRAAGARNVNVIVLARVAREEMLS